MKSLATVALATLSLFAVSGAHASMGPRMNKYDFKCSTGNDYSVYIVVTSGITVSYDLKAFCSVEADSGAAACLQDEAPETYTCYEEFKSLNDLTAGESLEIVHGR